MNTDSRRNSTRGFTLIELLVAIAIFGVLATFMYGGITTIVRDREIIMERLDELQELQRVARMLETDFLELSTREVRDELGRGWEPALYSNPADDFVVRLSRIGWRNPGWRRARGILQRVQYRLEDDVLYREYWPVMDRVLGTEPVSQELIKGVTEFEMEYLDGADEWQPMWPPRNATEMPIDELPQGVRYRLESESFGEIIRLIEIVQ